MALFDRKKKESQKTPTRKVQTFNNDIFQDAFDRADEQKRLFQEQLKQDNANRFQQNHPGFESDFNKVLQASAQAAPEAPKKNSKIPVVASDGEYAKTEVLHSKGVAKFSKECEQRVGAYSVIGKRDSQQDACDVTDLKIKDFSEKPWMAVLCDGMGGMNGGEQASALGVEKMINAFFNRGDKQPPDFYHDTLIEIDDAVYSLKDEYGNLLGAGSTIVSVFIDGNKFYWASVGDSHIYVIRKKEMIRVNKEHNYYAELEQLVKKGLITIEEANNDKNKEALTSYLGIGSLHMMDINKKPLILQKDDIIVLCSDGLYRSVSDNEIFHIVVDNNADMSVAAKALVDCAMSKNKKYQDNTTVITIRF